MRRIALTLGALGLCLAIGCSREERRAQVQAPPLVGRVQAPPNLRPTMVRFQQMMEEARRRGEGRLPMNRPARVVKKLALELVAPQPESFQRWRQKLLAASDALAASATKKDYNALVNTCVGCHQVYAKHTLSETRKLFLP